MKPGSQEREKYLLISWLPDSIGSFIAEMLRNTWCRAKDAKAAKGSRAESLKNKLRRGDAEARGRREFHELTRIFGKAPRWPTAKSFETFAAFARDMPIQNLRMNTSREGREGGEGVESRVSRA